MNWFIKCIISGLCLAFAVWCFCVFVSLDIGIMIHSLGTRAFMGVGFIIGFVSELDE